MPECFDIYIVYKMALYKYSSFPLSSKNDPLEQIKYKVQITLSLDEKCSFLAMDACYKVTDFMDAIQNVKHWLFDKLIVLKWSVCP